MHHKLYVVYLFQFILLSNFHWAVLSANYVKTNRSSDTSHYSKAKRSVAGAQPQIQGSVAGAPSSLITGQTSLNLAQQNVLSTDKGQHPLGQSLTPYALATGQATAAAATQPPVQPSTLTVKPQPAGQIANTITQNPGQASALTRETAGPGVPGTEELEEEPELDQARDDESECDDVDPEFAAACRRRRRRLRLQRQRHRRYRRPSHGFRGRRPRMRPLNDDFYGERENERVNDWLDFKGDPGYYEDNGQGNTGGTGGQGGIGGQGGSQGGIGGQGGSQGGIGGTGGGIGGQGGGGMGGGGGGMGGGGGGGGGRAEGTDCCCVKWGGLKPHVEWVNVPVCYRPCCIAKPHCEHCCDIDCHHCACEPCCGGCCCHHCCHHCPCCCHCCHCCHCRRGMVESKPPLATRKKTKKRTETKKTKKKKYHKRHCFCVTPLVMRMPNFPYFPRLW